MANEYATLAELKSYLGIDDTIDDGDLPTFLEAAARAIDVYCERSFYDTGAVTARDFVATGSYVTYIDDFSTAAGLIVQTDTAVDGTFATTLAGGTVQAEPLNGIVDGIGGYPFDRIRSVNGVSFPCVYQRRANLRVSARWGWAAVPAAVREVNLRLAKDMAEARKTVSGVVGFGEYGAVRISDTPRLHGALWPYRKRAGLLVGR